MKKLSDKRISGLAVTALTVSLVMNQFMSGHLYVTHVDMYFK
jgi:hypothetical protein